MIKKFEGQASKNPAPIQLALMENFIQTSGEKTPSASPDLSLINVKCEEYGINKNQIIQTDSLGSKLYLSEPERKELLKKLEKASISSKYVNENFDAFAMNILGVNEQINPKKKRRMLTKKETTLELEKKRLYNLKLKEEDEDFNQQTG